MITKINLNEKEWGYIEGFKIYCHTNDFEPFSYNIVKMFVFNNLKTFISQYKEMLIDPNKIKISHIKIKEPTNNKRNYLEIFALRTMNEFIKIGKITHDTKSNIIHIEFINGIANIFDFNKRFLSKEWVIN